MKSCVRKFIPRVVWGASQSRFPSSLTDWGIAMPCTHSWHPLIAAWCQLQPDRPPRGQCCSAGVHIHWMHPLACYWPILCAETLRPGRGSHQGQSESSVSCLPGLSAGGAELVVFELDPQVHLLVPNISLLHVISLQYLYITPTNISLVHVISLQL